MNDGATREYMQYFATQKCESEKMKRIHELVEKYRMDPAARKAYMTLEQELNLRYKYGFKEGREEGAEAAKKELAKGFRDKGISINVIMEITGLTPEEIKSL